MHCAFENLFLTTSLGWLLTCIENNHTLWRQHKGTDWLQGKSVTPHSASTSVEWKQKKVLILFHFERSKRLLLIDVVHFLLFKSCRAALRFIPTTFHSHKNFTVVVYHLILFLNYFFFCTEYDSILQSFFFSTTFLHIIF